MASSASKIEQVVVDLERVLQEARAALRAEREKEIPAEPKVHLIRFQKRFRDSSKTYEYAALRTTGRWYVTGAMSPQGATWPDLVAFITKDSVLNFEYAPQYTDVPF